MSDSQTVTPSYDLILVGVYAIASLGIQALPEGAISRVLIVLPLLFFIPGYLLVLVLFPAKHIGSTTHWNRLGLSSDHLGPTERVALSFGFSMIFLPFFAIIIWEMAGGIDPFALNYLVTSILILCLIAWFRRTQIPAERRYIPNPLGTLKRLNTQVASKPRVEQVFTVLLALAIVLAVGTFALAIASPQDGESYTEFIVGTGGEEEFTVAGYPTTVSPSDDVTYSILIGNHEGTTVEYDIDIEVQRVEDGEVVERVSVDAFTVEVEADEQTIEDRTFEPTLQGEVRIMFQLNIVDHEFDSADQAPYRSVHVWLTVTD